jgi:hypothetical protein
MQSIADLKNDPDPPRSMYIDGMRCIVVQIQRIVDVFLEKAVFAKRLSTP